MARFRVVLLLTSAVDGAGGRWGAHEQTVIADAVGELAATGHDIVVIRERRRAPLGAVSLGSERTAGALSPVTLDGIDAPAAGRLQDLGYAVVAYGNGVAKGEHEPSAGLDAHGIADVELAAARLGVELGAGAFVIATDESRVVLGRGTDHERPLQNVLQRDLHAYLEAGEFEGSPTESRLLALLWFIERAGNHATICDLGSIAAAAQGIAVGVIVAADDEALHEPDDDW